MVNGYSRQKNVLRQVHEYCDYCRSTVAAIGLNFTHFISRPAIIGHILFKEWNVLADTCSEPLKICAHILTTRDLTGDVHS